MTLIKPLECKLAAEGSFSYKFAATVQSSSCCDLIPAGLVLQQSQFVGCLLINAFNTSHTLTSIVCSAHTQQQSFQHCMRAWTQLSQDNGCSVELACGQSLWLRLVSETWLFIQISAHVKQKLFLFHYLVVNVYSCIPCSFELHLVKQFLACTAVSNPNGLSYAMRCLLTLLEVCYVTRYTSKETHFTQLI